MAAPAPAPALYVLVACLLCALVLPLVGAGATERRVVVLLAVGWLLGGLPFAIIGSSELDASDHSAELFWLWTLLVAATATAILVNRPVPGARAAPDRG